METDEMPMSDGRRRSDVTASALIMELIRDEQSPQERARLSVLMKITETLDANTRATQAIASRLEEHQIDFDTHRTWSQDFASRVDKRMVDDAMRTTQVEAQARGSFQAIRLAAGVLGFVATALAGTSLYIFNKQTDVIETQVRVNIEQEREIALLKAAIGLTTPTRK